MSEKTVNSGVNAGRMYKKQLLGCGALLFTLISFVLFHSSCHSQINLPDKFDLHSLVHHHLSDDQIKVLSEIITNKKALGDVAKRDDDKDKDKDKKKSNDDKDKDKDKKKSNNLLNQAWVRFLMAVAGLILINMVAIIVQHIYTKLTFSAKSYRSIEHDISPF